MFSSPSAVASGVRPCHGGHVLAERWVGGPSWMRNWAHFGDPDSSPGHLEGRFAYAVKGSAYVPGGDETGCVGFFSLLQGANEE